MTYSFHPEAHVEFKEATLHYSEKSRSLGSAFYSEVEYAIERIVENPLLYRVIDVTIQVPSRPHKILAGLGGDFHVYWNHEDSRTKPFTRRYSLDLQTHGGSSRMTSEPSFSGNLHLLVLG